MNNLREIAYRLDPVLWVREVLGVTPTPWQETFLRSPLGSIHSGINGAASGQDDHCGVGDCALHVVLARLVVGDWLSGSTPERGGGATGKSISHQGRR